MNVQHAPTAIAESRERHSYARLHGRWLVFARVVWVAVVVLALGLFIASIPTTFADLHILCTAPSCTVSGPLTPDDVRELQAWGLSMDFYATYIVVFIMVFAFGYFAVGAVLFWRLFTSPERPLC